jgi:poly(A) polymerase
MGVSFPAASMTGADDDAARARITALLGDRRLTRLLDVLNGAGEETRVVGGAVRNTLLGETVSDIDLATTCLPDETIRRAKGARFRAVPTGIEHGTVTIVVDGRPFEVTTLREDVATDGRHAIVRFGRDFATDARRRDFTVNALALTATGDIVDDCGGLDDLAARRIRFIGDPEARIREDYLRILRFFRFQAQYGQGPVDAWGLSACIRLRDGLDGLSRERIRAELMKLLAARRRDETVALLAGTGLWSRLTHGIARIGRLQAATLGRDPLLALAALELARREDAERLQIRLRLSNGETARLASIALALEVLGNCPRSLSSERARRLAFRHGREAMADAILIEAARFGGSRESLAQACRAVPPSPFRGADIIAAGVKPGRMVGEIVRAAEHLWEEADFPADPPRQVALLAQAIDTIKDSGRPARKGRAVRAT